MMSNSRPGANQGIAKDSSDLADEIIGRETKRAIRQGRLIGVDDVRQVSLIRRGDVVTALSRVGLIR